MGKRTIDIIAIVLIALWVLCPWAMYAEFALNGKTLNGGAAKGVGVIVGLFLGDAIPAIASAIWLAVRNRETLNILKQQGRLYRVHILTTGLLLAGIGAPLFLMAILSR
jgi:hypothetical protein